MKNIKWVYQIAGMILAIAQSEQVLKHDFVPMLLTSL